MNDEKFWSLADLGRRLYQRGHNTADVGAMLCATSEQRQANFLLAAILEELLRLNATVIAASYQKLKDWDAFERDYEARRRTAFTAFMAAEEAKRGTCPPTVKAWIEMLFRHQFMTPQPTAHEQGRGHIRIWHTYDRLADAAKWRPYPPSKKRLRATYDKWMKSRAKRRAKEPA